MRNTVLNALVARDPNVRLKAALHIGTERATEYLQDLVGRFGVEEDFFVREMLTWAITRMPVEESIPLLIGKLKDPVAQVRSQSLHTLSKLHDKAPAEIWEAITDELLLSEEEEVAQAAWRAAVLVVPSAEKVGLAETLATQFGRGSFEFKRSLTRAFGALGGEVLVVVDKQSCAHAAATRAWMLDSELDLNSLIAEV
ncbi:HEAT repeat domain-containing protein [Corynebacterium sp. S7]